MTNKTLFWSFFANFCTFCASLRLKRAVFSWLLKKAVSMALWTMASLFGKSSLLEQSLPRTPSRLISLCPLWLFSLFLCAFCAFLWLKNPFNLLSTKDYVRNYNKNMQNEPKLRKSQMNVNKVLTKDYDKKDTWSIGKNEPKTNPNEPKTNPNKANKMPKQTQTNPKQTQTNPKQTQTNPISEPI
ncbi:MAG: hypothetical protein ACYS91_02735 [Planctomycetota bacterium]|jgi:hypothetical protein